MISNRRIAVLILPLATALGIASAPAAPRTKARAAGGPTVTAIRSRTLSASVLKAAQSHATPGTPSTDKKTLTFHARSVRLVVTTGPEDDMLSYRINGLRNPTIVVPAGARVSLLFVNTDEDMFHDLRFTSGKPPFPARPDVTVTVGSRRIPHSEEGRYHGEEMTVRAPAVGSYSYLCTVPGHAKAGMYGRISVH